LGFYQKRKHAGAIMIEPESEPRIDWLGAIGPTLIFGGGHRQVLSRTEQLHVKLGLTDIETLAQHYLRIALLRSIVFNNRGDRK
jgi:hypothetical protein